MKICQSNLWTESKTGKDSEKNMSDSQSIPVSKEVMQKIGINLSNKPEADWFKLSWIQSCCISCLI